MSAYSIDLPTPPEEDHLQAQRDRQEAQIRQALNWHLIRQDVLEKLALAWLEGEGRLGVIVDQLTDAPIRDRFDLEGYLRHCAPRDAKALGQQVMTLLAQVVLAHVEATRDAQPF
jgi:hypothetical protein